MNITNKIEHCINKKKEFIKSIQDALAEKITKIEKKELINMKENNKNISEGIKKKDVIIEYEPSQIIPLYNSGVSDGESDENNRNAQIKAEIVSALQKSKASGDALTKLSDFISKAIVKNYKELDDSKTKKRNLDTKVYLLNRKIRRIRNRTRIVRIRTDKLQKMYEEILVGEYKRPFLEKISNFIFPWTFNKTARLKGAIAMNEEQVQIWDDELINLQNDYQKALNDQLIEAKSIDKMEKIYDELLVEREISQREKRDFIDKTTQVKKLLRKNKASISFQSDELQNEEDLNKNIKAKEFFTINFTISEKVKKLLKKYNLETD